MTFATGLRSMMRADPDIVMVGEIRDGESAHIAVEAALTGHLVLSTLHTNDAPSAVSRLTDMGIEPFLVASAVDCVVAQRLARKLCEPAAAARPARTCPSTYEPVGCPRCGGTGYKGRIGLFEIMTVTSEMHHLIVERASVDADRARDRPGHAQPARRRHGEGPRRRHLDGRGRARHRL